MNGRDPEEYSFLFGKDASPSILIAPSSVPGEVAVLFWISPAMRYCETRTGVGIVSMPPLDVEVIRVV